MDDVRFAVIGAGMAGLACAHALARADARVTVYERSRGLGGRLATRRMGPLAFDHGAQFITARSHPFSRYAEIALRAGMLDAWRPRIMEDDRAWPAPIEDWWIGQPGMSALVRPLARNIEIHGGVAVHELIPSQRGWELQTDSGRQNVIFRAVAVAVPAPQASALLGPHGRAGRPARHRPGVRRRRELPAQQRDEDQRRQEGDQLRGRRPNRGVQDDVSNGLAPDGCLQTRQGVER